ncbi:hypothetical protein [Mycobacterium deserti]|uniref:Uncharacterized protein n=1 Tax=Mycobacterium deserti TaxID=2978347 RepID=A0ABT2MJ06_9MYCO|nr:hypothetical protein [Mycobacterium deserti]MCT7661080.1 hypothetical protein [Mycobacterium deserti]
MKWSNRPLRLRRVARPIVLALGASLAVMAAGPAAPAAASAAGYEHKEPHRVSVPLYYPWGYHDLPGDGHSMGRIGWQAHAISGPRGVFAAFEAINNQSNKIGPVVADFDILKGVYPRITTGGKKPHGPKPGHGSGGPQIGLDFVDIGRWRVGVPEFAESTGKLGFESKNSFGADGIKTSIVGFNNQGLALGPTRNNIDIVKGAYLTITPGGKKDPCDPKPIGPAASLKLIDIGKWRTGIPGLLEWSGELGWGANVNVDKTGFNGGLWGVNKQSITIGPASFGFNFTPGFHVDLGGPQTKPGKPHTPHHPGDKPDKPSHLGDMPDNPGYGGDNPDKLADPLANAGHTPGQGDNDKPGHDGDKPGQSGERPGKGDDDDLGRDNDKPGQGGSKSGDKPGDTLANGNTADKPQNGGSKSDDKPGAEGDKPGNGGDNSDQGGGGSNDSNGGNGNSSSDNSDD